jgi:hypothetical protein
MMAFLTWVTVIYALVLVVVLVVSLIAILYYLWSIGTTLGKIRAGLLLVRDQTAPLGGQVEAINGALGVVAGDLSAARDDLLTVDSALAQVMGEAAPPASQVA